MLLRLSLVLALLTAFPAGAADGVDAQSRGRVVAPGPTQRPERRTTGSAFLVGSGGYLVTNAHVVAGCDDPQLVSGGSARPIRVVVVDTTIDIAILQSEADANRIGFNLAARTRLGQPVTVFGFPLVPTYAENGRATTGVVLTFSTDGRQLMTNAPVQAGNSGGPIIDQAGSVVGVAFGKTVNRTFAVAAAAVGEVLTRSNLSVPLSSDASVLSVAEIIEKARRMTGKVDCRK